MWNEICESFACEIERDRKLTVVEKVFGVVMVLSPVVSLVLLDVFCSVGKW